MAIERNTYTDILFDALMAAGCTIYGACAAMGNIYAESKMNPRNLENLCERLLGYKYTDDTYTEAVDSGKITRALFLYPLGDSSSTVTGSVSGHLPEEKPAFTIWSSPEECPSEMRRRRQSTC